MSERSMLDQALAYAAADWPVFPCKPGSKEPATPHGFYDASTDPDQVREWWGRHPDRNVAIATGYPGPDVLDVDVKPDGSGFALLNELKRAGLVDGYHAIVRTPSTGLHLYYEGTEQGNGSLPGRHLDFRSKGGYVVAPPSRGQGAGYAVVKHGPAEGSTVSWRAIREHVEPQPQRPPQRQRDPERGNEGRLDRLVEWTASRQAGDRNFPLFYAARQAAEAGLLDGQAVERFVDAAHRSGLAGGEREARRTIASAQRHAEQSAGRPMPRVQVQHAEPDPAAFIRDWNAQAAERSAGREAGG